jgi:hypothetical protein
VSATTARPYERRTSRAEGHVVSLAVVHAGHLARGTAPSSWACGALIEAAARLREARADEREAQTT